MILYVWNDTYLKNENVVNGVICSDFAKEIGFENGDKIIAVDGLSVDRFSDINKDMVLRDESFVVDVVRNEYLERVEIGNNFIKHWKNSGKEKLFIPRTLVKGLKVTKNSFSEKGIKPGDLLMSVNGISTRYFDEFKVELLKNKSKTVSVGLDRGGLNKVVEVEVSENGTIGFSIDNNLDLSVEKFSFLESFPAGYNLCL